MTLNQIIFEHIDDKYAYGKYADFTIIMMKENRYINATKLCDDHKKLLKNWTKNESSQKLIGIVDKKLEKNRIGSNLSLSSTGNVNSSIIQITSKKFNGILRGTYVHELLIPHIASWVSPEFGIMVSEIINNHIANEYTKSLKQKDDKIDELMNLIKEERIQAEQRANEIKQYRGVHLWFIQLIFL